MPTSFRHGLPMGAALLVAVSLAGCAGGSSPSMSASASREGQSAGYAPQGLTRMLNTVSGRVGLPPSFHLPLAGAPAARNWLSAEAAAKSS